MNEQSIHIKKIPQLSKPILIAGFDGWGNALDISTGMVEYLITRLDAEPFADINPDIFYQYNEARPLVNIEAGTIKNNYPPGGSFYTARTGSDSDLVILRATEPSLRWYHFSEELFSLCSKLGVETIITLGSMFDNVIHYERMISCVSSDDDLFSRLKQKDVIPIYYQGPSAIHSTIQTEGQKKGFRCTSLWAHCPYYIEGATHFGILSSLCGILALLCGFELDTDDLEEDWEELNEKIESLIEDDPHIEELISDLREKKKKGTLESIKQSLKKGEKVINIKDFL
ncbi:MAG: hypothetical protein GY795_48180 [Desulfobacterales bacterium]|nr:hypothetical protein [Desulfobacterales bacterium]